MNGETNEKSKSAREKFDGIYQEDSLPAKLSKDYRILSCLKHTEEKRVYVLEEKDSKKQYILKCRLKKEEKLLQQEYETLTSIEEEFAPKAVSFFVEEDTAYLLREYIAGETLEQKVAKAGVYELKEAINTMISVCHIVQRMHKHEPILVHRDIKPENILVTKEGKYIFIDMDTVREYKEESSYDTVFMGSWGVAAPEQFGFGQTDPRTDIYSLGVLFLFLLTGKYKMERADWQDIPKSIRETIQKCMEFDAKNRYPSVDALCLELNSLKRFSKRRKEVLIQGSAIFAGFVTIVLVIILCVGTGSKRKSEDTTDGAIEERSEDTAGEAENEDSTEDKMEAEITDTTEPTEEIAEVLDGFNYDVDGACHIYILRNEDNPSPPYRGLDYEAINPEMGEYGSFEVTPYWTEVPGHPGKIQPGNEENYNLKYDCQKNIMYMRDLNLDISFFENPATPAIMTDTDLTIVLEGNNIVTCHAGIPFQSEDCTITFEGSGDLTLRATDDDWMPAFRAGGDLVHNGTGTITLEPCGTAYGMEWLTPGEILGDGKWVNLPISPYDRDSEFAIIIEGLSWEPGFTGVWIDGFAWDGRFEGNRFWKNDPEHPGKLLIGTESDYNLKYVDGKLYLKELTLEVASSGSWVSVNAVQIGKDMPTTIVLEEGDSSITGVNVMAFDSDSSVTFEGSGNLTLRTEGDFDGDCPALAVRGDITHNGTGTITLISSERSKNGGSCEGILKGNGKWVNPPVIVE